jgi:tight adherence protein C
MNEMLLTSVMAGIALFLYGLPACLERGNTPVDSLLGRIDQEQQAHLDQSFHRKKSRIRILELLAKREGWLRRASEWTGVDLRKTEEILSRLHWRVSVAEIVLCRGISMVFVGSSILYLLAGIYTGQGLKLANGWPLMVSLILYLCPTLLLEWADKRAKAEIQAQVPVFFSIVQSLVEAGMPLQSAVKQTARRFDARLGHELLGLETEEKRYGTWRKALEELAFRWEVDGLTTIAMEMNEAIRKGISISAMLAVQVEEQMRMQEDEASAQMNRLNIRLLPFVIVLMGVPLLFLVMGPVLMSIGERM